MEELLFWKEKLQLLDKGKRINLNGEDKPSSVYSAVRDNPELFSNKKFSIRTHPVTLKKHVIRTK